MEENKYFKYFAETVNNNTENNKVIVALEGEYYSNLKLFELTQEEMEYLYNKRSDEVKVHYNQELKKLNKRYGK